MPQFVIYFDPPAGGGLNAQYSVVGRAAKANFDALAGGGVNARLIFRREVNCAALSREVNQTDVLLVPCDWLFAARVTLSGAHASELITNSGLNLS